MSEQENVDFDCNLKFSLLDTKAVEIAGGDARTSIEKENLSLLPGSGTALFFPFRDMDDIQAVDYRVRIDLSSREQLSLFHLGYKYEDFVSALHKNRNEILLEDMLARETVRNEGISAEFAYQIPDGSIVMQGRGKVRLYETSLAILPEHGEIIRIPLGYIDEVRQADYRLLICGDSGEKIILSKVGSQLDPFMKSISLTLNDLSQKNQSFLKELMPEANPEAVRKVAGLMKEGRAATKGSISAISPALWAGLEKQLSGTPIGDEFEFLKSIGREDKAAIGFKRGLVGDLSGDTLWFLVPIYSKDPRAGGNALVMEAATIRRQETEGSGLEPANFPAGENDEIIKQEGRATYFFRIVSRGDYPHFKNTSDLDPKVDRFIEDFNRCMLEVNFRREPIYLPQEKLLEPAYRKYRFSLKRLPALRMLRSHFIGRVMHRSRDQWRKDTEDLLRFNVSCPDDEPKWKRGG